MARHYNQWRCLFGSLDFPNMETSNWNHLLWMTRFFVFVANSLISFLNSYVAQIMNMGYLDIQIPTRGSSETDHISPRVFKPESAKSLSMEKRACTINLLEHSTHGCICKSTCWYIEWFWKALTARLSISQILLAMSLCSACILLCSSYYVWCYWSSVWLMQEIFVKSINVILKWQLEAD